MPMIAIASHVRPSMMCSSVVKMCDARLVDYDQKD
jgi:hypothetical protein